MTTVLSESDDDRPATAFDPIPAGLALTLPHDYGWHLYRVAEADLQRLIEIQECER